MFGCAGDPDADADPGFAEDPKRIASTERCRNALGDLDRFGRGCIWQNDRKFVAAQPRRRIILAHALLQPFGDLLQEGAACRVTELIVYTLEAIKIEAEQSASQTVFDTFECGVETGVEQPSVGQPGQTIRMRTK